MEYDTVRVMKYKYVNRRWENGGYIESPPTYFTVTLQVDPVALIERLAPAACKSKHGKSQLGHGAIRLVAKKE